MGIQAQVQPRAGNSTSVPSSVLRFGSFDPHPQHPQAQWHIPQQGHPQFPQVPPPPYLGAVLPQQQHPQQEQAPLQSPDATPQVQVGGVPPQVPSSNVPGAQPGTTNVQGAASRICPSLMSALWATADDGRMALGYFGTSGVTDRDMATIIVTLCALLPVAQFAPGYAFWMRNPTATISVFAVTFQSVYPALHARLVAVGSLVGLECQHAIRALTVELYGMFAGQAPCVCSGTDAVHLVLAGVAAS